MPPPDTSQRPGKETFLSNLDLTSLNWLEDAIINSFEWLEQYL